MTVDEAMEWASWDIDELLADTPDGAVEALPVLAAEVRRLREINATLADSNVARDLLITASETEVERLREALELTLEENTELIRALERISDMRLLNERTAGDMQDISREALQRAVNMDYKVWDCKIVVPADTELPAGFDSVPRSAAQMAIENAGITPVVIFSGWGGSLTDSELQTVLMMDLTERPSGPSDGYIPKGQCNGKVHK